MPEKTKRVTPTAWPERELNILREQYPKRSAQAIHDEYLPRRSEKAIQAMAKRLGLHKTEATHPRRPSTAPRWTAEELNILRTNFPRMSTARLREEKLPQKTESSITGMANRLGLKKIRTVRPYTDTELAVIKQFTGNVSPECLQKLVPNRTYNGINAAVKCIGTCACDHNEVRTTHWRTCDVPQRTLTVIQGLACAECGKPLNIGDPVLICPRCGATFCAEHEDEAKTHVLGHNGTPAPETPVDDLGNSPWTNSERDMLRLHYAKMPHETLKHLYFPNRSVAAIKDQAKRLGLIEARRQTVNATIRQFYGNVTLPCLQRLLPNYSQSGIGHIARRIGGIKTDPSMNTTRGHHYAVHRITAVITGLSCAACGKPIPPGDEILICPECAAVFCTDHADEADRHFRTHSDDETR